MIGLQYQIRLCPALQKKPTKDTFETSQSDTKNEKKDFDPFTPPYNEKLYVGELIDEESLEEFVILVRNAIFCSK